MILIFVILEVVIIPLKINEVDEGTTMNEYIPV